MCVLKIYVNHILMFKLKVAKMKLAEYTNSVDPDEEAHYEPPHLDLHYLLSNL